MIGPVRSVRAEDPDIVWPIGGIFAYSGGAPVNVDAINAAPVHAVDENTAGDAMVRNEPNQPPRDAPHNLYGLGQPLFDLGGEPVPPPPLFQYLRRRCAGRSPPSGVIDFHVGFEAGLRPDLDLGRRHRHLEAPIDGVPADRRRRRADRTGQRGGPVHRVRRRGRGADRRRGRRLDLQRRHRARTGRWVRPDKAQPAQATSTAPGNPIPLRAGRTWVELLPVGSAVDVTDGAGAGDHRAAGHDRAADHGQEEEVERPRRRSGRPVRWAS